MIIPYLTVKVTNNKQPFPIEEVVVGPTPNQKLSIDSVSSLFKSKGWKIPRIIPSEIPYRSW